MPFGKQAFLCIYNLFIATDNKEEVIAMNEYQVEHLRTKDDHETLKIDNYFVHSRYSPLKEAERYIDKHYTFQHTHILFGYGAGHVHEAFKKQRKANELLITIDPLIKTKQLNIQKKHQQDYIFGAEMIEKLEFLLAHIDNETRTTFTILCTSNYDKIFPNVYKALLQKIKDIQEANRVNDYTIIRYADKWQENLELNLINLTKDASLVNLKKYYDAPVIIASSGPSLTKQLPLLNKIRKNIILISSGSTTNVLLAHGITPDFVVSMDGGEPNYKHFKDLKLTESKLVYTYQNHPGVREAFTQECFVCNNQGFSGVDSYMAKHIPTEIPVLLGGSTVANLAFSVGQYISTGPIAFIGQDLAYTGNVTHVSGHNHSKGISKEFLEEREGFETVGYYGDKVWTSPPMYSMKLEFEKMIVLHPPVNKFYNCTEGGVKIKGYEQCTFQEFCNEFIDTNIQFKKRPTNFEACIQEAEIQQLFEHELVQLTQCIELYEEGINVVEMNKSDERFTAKSLKKLEEIDGQARILLNDMLVDIILSPIVMSIINGFLPKENETVRQSYKRVKEQNLTLYKESIRALEKTKSYIENAMKKLQEVTS